ncbi:MAG TPA: NAD(P)H-binding protein [Panacibacter sp.]|nr:NAD(P)H-binding protein [Panacibacter sp.]
MKYVITGSLGNVSKPLTKALVKAGNDVTVITSKEQNIAAIEALGAKAAVGSVENIAFLTGAFTGADAVYTMVPPTYTASDWKAHIAKIGENYTAAIKAAGVKYVVNLSSIGAHMQEGAGPVSGLYRAESALNTLTDVNIKHLRPAYFYANLLSNIGMIKHMGVLGANFGEKTFPLVHTDDIAEVAIEELLKLNFKGHTVRYIASDEKTGFEIAKALGTAIGQPDIPWIVFTDEQSLEGMLQAGLPKEVARNYTEMGAAMSSGEMNRDYFSNRPAASSKIKIEDFAKEFAAAFHA